MLKFASFANAPYVVGRGSLQYLVEYLCRVDGGRVALVSDVQAMEKGGFLARLQDCVTEAGATCELVADVKREPHTGDVGRFREEVFRFRPDRIVALGGGAVIDVAKALWFFYEYPEATWEQAFTPFALPPLGQKAELVAIPTTSGTGSETTCVAVLINDESRRKRLMMSRELIPRLAILDPDLADTMPMVVAAHSGLDALAHALEAAVCRTANPMVVSLALAAALDIIDWLPAAVAPHSSPENQRQAREVMHIAAGMAGMAINNASAGLSHAMDQIGPQFGFPHGLVCGILLPYTVRFTCPHAAYTTLARRLGYGGDDEAACSALVNRLWELARGLGVPAGFAGLGVPEAEFERQLGGLVEEALASGSTQLAPVIPDAAAMSHLFWEAYHGCHPLDSIS